MMNVPETAGEPSCKRQENGDASTGSERPLKKARFAWQVKGKGKYHLKNESPGSKNSFTGPDEAEAPGPSQSESNTHNLVGNTEQNLEILGDYLLKQDFNTLDSVITDPDKSPLLKPSTSISSEKLDYPRYVTSFDNSGSRASSRAETVAIPMCFLPQIYSYTEEQCIARWQARQMAKGFVDNTINRVLDSWMVAPLPADIGNRFLALDVAEFINNLPGDNSIENEGILMAISAHGLQNNSASSSDDHSHTEEQSSTKDNYTSRSSSPLAFEDELKNSNNEEDNSHNMNDLMSWSCENDDANNSNTTFEQDSSSSYLNYTDEDLVNDYTSHYDFVDAAVTFAIQNKGLTSFGTEYG